MNRICDLHTHSYYSDGTASPAGILALAQEKGLTAVALTDHNTVQGLPEFLQAARERGLRAIPGIEISTGYAGRELHIVGLFLQEAVWDRVTDYVSVINTRKEESNRRLIAALRELGYDLDLDDLKRKHKGNINRAIIAAEMVEKGYLQEIRDGFKGVLSARNGVYVPPERIPALEAIAFLRSVGAVPVLAHPYLNLKQDELERFIVEAKPCGLLAMETRYSTYTPETTEAAIRTAEQYGLLESGGSDYHGGNKPDIDLGSGRGDLCVPAELLSLLEKMR